jgi:hypothetical protein
MGRRSGGRIRKRVIIRECVATKEMCHWRKEVIERAKEDIMYEWKMEESFLSPSIACPLFFR